MSETGSGGDAAFDVIVIGAGFSGLYALHRLRGAGFRVRVLEMASGVGGTWYWNRYPGARCDIESLQYSYSFSDALQQEWEWSEKYATQEEIRRYAEHVADRFDLRRDIQLDTRVEAASWDEGARLWRVDTQGGERLAARFLVTAVGCLSAANLPDIPGRDDFEGETWHTGLWPHEGVDFTGRRVAVIGTGSSAIQSIPLIAAQAGHLHVFQRTPNYAVPAWNGPLDPAHVREVKADYAGLRARARARPPAFWFPFNPGSALEATPEERERQYEACWRRGGLPFLGAYGDLMLDERANETAAEFVRGKIRSIVKDPEVAARLCPDNVIGCKRLCVDTDYYATYNRPNVTLVDVSDRPIERITPRGIETGGIEYPVDAIVFATGFDAMTGALERLGIRGRGGLALREKWRAGPRTCLGLMTEGFPNLFMITGPGSPSVLTNMIMSIEQHVEWIERCLRVLRAQGRTRMEAERQAEDAWVEHGNAVAAGTLRATCSSWYLGANIPGKPRVFMPYAGGFPDYEARCRAVEEAGYEGFRLE